jgi:hypothetical protein
MDDNTADLIRWIVIMIVVLALAIIERVLYQ